MVSKQILELEKQTLSKLYNLIPDRIVSVKELSLKTLSAKTNIQPVAMGRVLQGLSKVGLITLLGVRGGLQYGRTQANTVLTEAQLTQAVDAIHLQDGLSSISFVRLIKKQLSNPKHNQPTKVLNENLPSVEKPVLTQKVNTSNITNGEFGKSYFIITPDNTIGYGRLETIQAVFDDQDILGYRYEIVTKNRKSYIVENLYPSVIEASKHII